MKNVLIVNGEKPLLISIKAGFKAYRDKFSIFTAENGKAAVHILEATPIDLVVTDLKIPDMDGFELLMLMQSHYPNIPAIVMTASDTPQIETKLKESGMLRLIEKPVDFVELSQTILKSLNENYKGGTLTGISLPSFLQLIEMEQNTCLMEVSTPSGEQGLLYFHQGVLYDALFKDKKGEEAVHAMLVKDDVKISFRSLPEKRFKKNIKSNLMTILMEGVRRKDALHKKNNKIIPLKDKIKDEQVIANDQQPNPETINEPAGEVKEPHPQKDADSIEESKGDSKMAKMNEVLGKLKVVGGFLAVGVFSPNGEMVAEVNAAGINIGELGAIANDVLLKAQKATEMMNVGRGQVVHVESPKVHIIARCLNEATDFATTSTGRAHVHMVLILDKEDGNLAFGKMKMQNIIHELSDFFR